MGSNSLLPHGQRKYFTSPVECRQFEEVLTVPICWEDHNADDDGVDDSTGAMTNFWLNYLPCSISLRMCGWPLLMYNLISWRFVDDCRWNIPSTASALAVVSRSSFRYVTLRSHPIPYHTIPYQPIRTHVPFVTEQFANCTDKFWVRSSRYQSPRVPNPGYISRPRE